MQRALRHTCWNRMLLECSSSSANAFFLLIPSGQLSTWPPWTSVLKPGPSTLLERCPLYLQSEHLLLQRGSLLSENYCVSKTKDWQWAGTLNPGLHPGFWLSQLLRMPSGAHALGGKVIIHKKQMRDGRWRKSGKAAKKSTLSRLPSPLFNGKSRRELGNIFFCFVGFRKLKKNLPPVILAQLAKHFVISALSL